jgi:hypothetical protein
MTKVARHEVMNSSRPIGTATDGSVEIPVHVDAAE